MPSFAVFTTARFDREFRKLVKRHPELVPIVERVVQIVGADPFNKSLTLPIRKLVGVPPGEGQFRVRIGRFRFRYDLEEQNVYLKGCAMRSETTYRR